MQSAHQVIVRARRRHELSDLRVRQATRIGDPGQVVAILLEVLDVLVGRHPDDDQLAVFVGRADGFDPHARRRCGERAVVLQRVGVVGQLGRRPDVIPEDILRGRYARDLRQMIDERADEVGLSRPFLDELGEVVILRLRRVTRFGDHLLRRHRDGSEKDRRTNHESDAPHCRNSLSRLD